MGVGAQCLNCRADGAKCCMNYVWLTNYVQNWGVSCATFCGAGVGWTVALRCNVFSYEKGLRKPKAFAFTMVETRGIEPLTS